MKTLILSVITATLLSAGVAWAGDGVRPNILFILADDKCYDAHRESPNLAL